MKMHGSLQSSGRNSNSSKSGVAAGVMPPVSFGNANTANMLSLNRSAELRVPVVGNVLWLVQTPASNSRIEHRTVASGVTTNRAPSSEAKLIGLIIYVTFQQIGAVALCTKIRPPGIL